MSSVIRPFFFNLQNTATTPVNTIRTTYNALKSNPEVGKLLTKQVALKALGACAAALAAYCSYQSMNAWNVSPLDPNPAFEPAANPQAEPSFPTVTVSEKFNVPAEQFTAVNIMPESTQNTFETEATLSAVLYATEAGTSVIADQSIVSVLQSQSFADASKDYCNASYVSPNFVDSIQASLKTDFSQAKPKTKYLEEVSDGQDDEISFNKSVRVCAAAAPATPKVYVPVTVEQHIKGMRQREAFTQASQGFCNASATNSHAPQKNQPKLKTDFSQPKAKAESPKKETYKNESFMPFCEAKSSFSESQHGINKADDFENSSEKSFQYEFPFQNKQANYEPVNHGQDKTSFASQDSDSFTPNFASTVTKACIGAAILLGTIAKYQWSNRQAEEAIVEKNSSPLSRVAVSGASEKQVSEENKTNAKDSENTNTSGNGTDVVNKESDASRREVVNGSIENAGDAFNSKEVAQPNLIGAEQTPEQESVIDNSSSEQKVEKKRLDKGNFTDGKKKTVQKSIENPEIRPLTCITDSPVRPNSLNPKFESNPSKKRIFQLTSNPKNSKQNNIKDLSESNGANEVSSTATSSTAIVMSNSNNSHNENIEDSSSAGNHLLVSSGQQISAEEDEVENENRYRQSMNKVLAMLPKLVDVDNTESDTFTNEDLEAYANGASDSEDEGQPDLIDTENFHEQESVIYTSSSEQKAEKKKLNQGNFTDRNKKLDHSEKNLITRPLKSITDSPARPTSMNPKLGSKLPTKRNVQLTSYPEDSKQNSKDYQDKKLVQVSGSETNEDSGWITPEGKGSFKASLYLNAQTSPSKHNVVEDTSNKKSFLSNAKVQKIINADALTKKPLNNITNSPPRPNVHDKQPWSSQRNKHSINLTMTSDPEVFKAKSTDLTSRKLEPTKQQPNSPLSMKAAESKKSQSLSPMSSNINTNLNKSNNVPKFNLNVPTGLDDNDNT